MTTRDITAYYKWHQSLTAAEFYFDGVIQKGEWTQVIVDLSPVTIDQLEHVECELVMSAIQLK
jgi:hypothetical protein